MMKTISSQKGSEYAVHHLLGDAWIVFTMLYYVVWLRGNDVILRIDHFFDEIAIVRWWEQSNTVLEFRRFCNRFQISVAPNAVNRIKAVSPSLYQSEVLLGTQLAQIDICESAVPLEWSLWRCTTAELYFVKVRVKFVWLKRICISMFWPMDFVVHMRSFLIVQFYSVPCQIQGWNYVELGTF